MRTRGGRGSKKPENFADVLYVWPLRTSALGREGGSPKADIVREFAWIYSYRSIQNSDKGGEGVKKPEYFADVLYVWPLEAILNMVWFVCISKFELTH